MPDERDKLQNLITWGSSQCRCCPMCWGNPCDGVMQGGICDMMMCFCYDDYEEEERGGMNEEQFEQWCIIEIMGHQRLAGLASEFTLGGQSMVRVDVPAVKGR